MLRCSSPFQRPQLPSKKPPMRCRAFAFSFLIAVTGVCISATTALARVVKVEILSRADVTGTFAGRVYERLTGRVYFAFDPRSPYNKQIVDLHLAPRNASGEVEAVSEFVMLR